LCHFTALEAQPSYLITDQDFHQSRPRELKVKSLLPNVKPILHNVKFFILRSGGTENLCRTQVEIELTRSGTVTDLLRAALGNHPVLVFGHATGSRAGARVPREPPAKLIIFGRG
jgi:hypothetical protein